MTSKQKFIDLLNTYPVIPVEDGHQDQLIFSEAPSENCFLANYFSNKYIDLAERIYFTMRDNRPKIQYYSSRRFNYNLIDFKLFEIHLKKLYSQLHIALKKYKQYKLQSKLDKLNKDF